MLSSAVEDGAGLEGLELAPGNKGDGSIILNSKFLKIEPSPFCT